MLHQKLAMEGHKVSGDRGEVFLCNRIKRGDRGAP